MLPTDRDIETIAEIRRARRREADHYRMMKSMKNSQPQSKLQVLLGWLEQDLIKRFIEKNEISVDILPDTGSGVCSEPAQMTVEEYSIG